MSRHAQPVPMCACAQPAHWPARVYASQPFSAIAQRHMPAHLQHRQPVTSKRDILSFRDMAALHSGKYEKQPSDGKNKERNGACTLRHGISPLARRLVQSWCPPSSRTGRNQYRCTAGVLGHARQLNKAAAVASRCHGAHYRKT